MSGHIHRCLTLAGAVIGSILGAAPHALAACDRACLAAAVSTYLKGLYAHDPAASGLAADFRATENATVVKLGSGLWKTASGSGPVQRIYVDTQTGQAAMFGEVKEGGATDIVSLRVKVTGGRVAEAEWTIARPGNGMFSLEGLAQQPPPDAILPPAARMTRAQLVAGADAYYQALQDHDGSHLPHAAGCDRVENGVRVTNRVGRPPPVPGAATPPGTPLGAEPPGSLKATTTAPGPGMEMRSGDCVAGFDRFAHTIASTDLRRYPVADVEKGVVLGETLFHRPPNSPMKRNLLNEYFWLHDGKITGMYAAMFYLPPDAPDGNGGWR